MRRILYFALLMAGNVWAQTYDTNQIIVQTFAGSGFSGWVDGVGTQTMFNGPESVVADSQGNLFVLDNVNNRIRKITPGGIVSTFAGSGAGYLPGYGTNISFGGDILGPMSIDRSNVLWIVTLPSYPSLIRIGSDGYVSRTNLVGSDLYNGKGVCIDSGNNLYISDSFYHKIYRYRTNGVWEVFAGSGNAGSLDGNGIFTSFTTPAALAADAADNIYVWDSGNYLIRRINQSREVVTISGKKGVSAQTDGVGTNASFNSIYGMCVDGSGNVILACGSSIRKMTPSTNVLTMAGSFTQSGYTNGAGSLARFRNATGVCVSQGMILVADSTDHRIRNLTFNPAPQPVSGANLNLSAYPGLRITGVVGRTYRIESSLNMTNWITETTILLTSSPYLWIDPNSLGQKKFYRALLLP